MPSWEEMCQQVVIAGRPGDVASAALGWDQLLKNLNSVKESLEKNVKDLGEVWKGPAYDSFKTHVEQIAKDTGRIVEDAQSQNGIVQSLNDAADKLSAAQAEFPIPASCVNDVLEARNGRLVISTGFFEMKVKPDFLGLLDPLTSLADWINDRSDEAAKVYNQVSGEYTSIDSGTPGQTTPLGVETPGVETPNLNGGPGAGSTGNVPSMSGMPSTGSMPGMGGTPSLNSADMPGTGNPDIGSSTHPDLTGGGYDPSDGYTPSTDSLADDYGSGLAGAAPSTSGLGGGGLPGTSGLGGGGLGGSGGGGLGGGGGVIPGGGSLGRPVTPNMMPMMGGGAAGANRGGGGRGGKLGMGGMGPMMGGGAAGNAGRGGARAGAAGAGAKGAGVRGGGIAGMGGAGGAGYGDEDLSRNTWLEEDEDVWGADSGGAPGILR
ncbi:WXG100 family type VII secretion target [Micromonospora sp. NPDC047620]|uniref:WXG100 family type VII secretion target n=1 Tax=Micromonospora sp. NPDC047620 TaxID=3364251 RepID=UPI0037130B35